MRIWLAILGLVGAFLSGGAYLAGVRAERAAWEARIANERAAWAEQVQKLAEQQAQKARAADVAVQASQERIRVVTRTIREKVPVYVTPESDARCVVPAGAVRLLNAAAQGVPPAPEHPALPHAAPSGVALSAVVGTTVDNYGTCHADQDRLSKLQALLVGLGMAPVTAEVP